MHFFGGRAVFLFALTNNEKENKYDLMPETMEPNLKLIYKVISIFHL
jgi:hypothetical protein